jgi:hypothetical protein
VRTVIMVTADLATKLPQTTMRQGAPGTLVGQPRRLRESEVHGRRALPIISANNSGR